MLGRCILHHARYGDVRRYRGQIDNGSSSGSSFRIGSADLLGVLRFHGSGYKASHQEGPVNIDFHQALEVDKAGICDWIKGSTRDLKYQMLAKSDPNAEAAMLVQDSRRRSG